MWPFKQKVTYPSDLTELAGMTSGQLAVLKKHIAVARQEGRKEVEWRKDVFGVIASVVFGVGAFVFLFSTGRVAVEVIKAVHVEKPPPPELTAVGNSWSLLGKAPDGQFIWVREPEPGVRCYYDGCCADRIDHVDDRGSLGCVNKIEEP